MHKFFLNLLLLKRGKICNITRKPLSQAVNRKDSLHLIRQLEVLNNNNKRLVSQAYIKKQIPDWIRLPSLEALHPHTNEMFVQHLMQLQEHDWSAYVHMNYSYYK